MGLHLSPMFFTLIMFISCFFSIDRAEDCSGNQIVKTIIVDKQSGKGDFVTVQDAIKSMETNNNQWVKIHINSGIYNERVEIPKNKPCVILEGSGIDTTIITYGNPHSTTDWESTFSSYPSNVIVHSLTFENSYNLGDGNPILPALAAAFFGDKSVIFNSKFVGYQDTLFAAVGRHYFKNCIIEGEADFIFGSGQSYFENCRVKATLKKDEFPGFVTAQRRDSPENLNGFVFKGGSIDGNGTIFLGRPWGPYSRVIFLGTYFSSIIIPQGWNPWNLTQQVDQLTYAEIDCQGPGANNKERVSWMKKDMSNSELNEYSLSSFINKDGWLDNLPPISL